MARSSGHVLLLLLVARQGRAPAAAGPAPALPAAVTGSPRTCTAELVVEGRPLGAGCPRPARSPAECTAAALQLPGPAAVAGAAARVSQEDRPAACWWQPANGLLFFNEDRAPEGADGQDRHGGGAAAWGSAKCSEAVQCICCRPDPPVVGHCAASERRTAALVLACDGGAAAATVELQAGETLALLELPAGAAGLRLRAAGHAQLGLRLLERRGGDCVVGRGCKHSAGCASNDDFCINHEGASIYYSGLAAVEPKGSTAEDEVIIVSGALRHALVLAANASAAGKATIEYSLAALAPCPQPLPGCSSCSSYTGCSSTEVPQCDGSASVACVPAGSVNVISSIRPASISAGHPTGITLSGRLAPGGVVAWAKACGAVVQSVDAVLSAADTEAKANFTVPAPGTYRLCYRPVGVSRFAEQADVVLSVVEATSHGVITDISPKRAIAGMATSILLVGTVLPGDRVAWAKECGNAEPLEDPADGTDGLSTFGFEAPGSYKLCLRRHGGSDAVEQRGVELTVVEDRAAVAAPCVPQVAAAGRPPAPTCPRHARSLEECAGAAKQHPEVQDVAPTGRAAGQSAEDRPAGCWWQPTTGGLFFNVPPPGAVPPACSEAFRCICCGSTWPNATFTAAGGKRPRPSSASRAAAVILAVSPRHVPAGTAVTLALVGDVGPGDLVAWEVSCANATALRAVDPTDGQDALTTFTVAAPGTYRLCHRPQGSIAFTAQRHVTLTVVQDPRPRNGTCYPELVAVGRPFGASCPRPVLTVEACSLAAAKHPELSATAPLSAQVTEDRPSGCWWQSRDSRLYFNVPPPEQPVAHCSESFMCLCCGDAMPTSTGARSTVSKSRAPSNGANSGSWRGAAATTTTTTGRPWPCSPEVVILGTPFGETCSQPAQSAEECGRAAAQHLGLADDMEPEVQSTRDRPAGCWWQPSNTGVYFNTPPPGYPRQPCTDTSRCICCSAAEPVATTCGEAQFQTAALVLECEGSSGSQPLALAAGQAQTLAVLPAGAVEARFKVTGAAGLDLRLVHEASDECLVGEGCQLSSVCSDERDFCMSHQDASFNFGGQGVTRTIAVVGILHSALLVRVRAPRSVTVEVASSHAPLAPCPKVAPGCQPCAAYKGCGNSEAPLCNGSAVVACADAGRTSAIVGLEPASVSAGAATKVRLKGKKGQAAWGDRIAWAEHCGPSVGSGFAPAVDKDSRVIVALASPGRYRLCYQAKGLGPFVEQVGIWLTVVEATSPELITAVAPFTVMAGVPTTVLLLGTVAPGDQVAWAADCRDAALWEQPTAGTDTLSTFTVLATGMLRLCYRAREGSDSVAQAGVSLRAVERPASSPAAGACLPELVATGKPFGDRCLEPLRSLEACEGVAGQVLGRNISFESGGHYVKPQVAEDRPYGCWWQAGSQRVFFNVPPPWSRPVGCSEKFRCLCCGAAPGASHGPLRGAGGRPRRPI